MLNKLVLLIIVLFIALVVLAAAYPRRQRRYSDAIEAKPILSKTEREFFYLLLQALPDYHVFAQVALGAILQPTKGLSRSAYYSLRGRFSQKFADFVICERRTLKILAVIELDDKTHDTKKEKDRERDEMLKSAGYLPIRFESRDNPSEADIIAALFKSEPHVPHEPRLF